MSGDGKMWWWSSGGSVGGGLFPFFGEKDKERGLRLTLSSSSRNSGGWWIRRTLIILGVVVANLVQNETALVNYSSGVGGLQSLQQQQSDKFIPCHFNSMCYCKYDQRTEIYDSLRRLWQLAGFNQTTFLKSIAAFQKDMRNDPSTTYFITEADFTSLVHLVVNSTSSYSSYYKFDPGPVYEFICINVPLALIPTDYNAHGVLSHVSVTGSKLSMLDGSAFAGLEIQNIQLSRNELYFISEYAFSSMSNSLTVLDLSANFLDEIPFTAFKTLKLLEWLNLSNNLVHSLAGDWFSLSVSLRQLTLSANSIDILPYKLFPAFSRMIWLDLSSNFIRNLTQHNLPPNLQTLILMKNPVSHFPSGVFHLRSLSWLVLAGCAIDRVPTDWPRGIGPLQMNQLDLTENFIQVWPSKPFGAQLTVLDLDVSKNYIEKLPAAAFHSMNSFRLSLGYNRIQSIDPNAFETLEHTLQYLNLDSNRLKVIPWSALHNLTSLMHLYVGSNHIQDDGLSSPEGKECKLTYLGLNGNQLTRLPRRLLARCSNLLHLNLGYNQIAHLDELAHLSIRGKKLRNLSTLVLRNNPIYTLAYINSNNELPLTSGGGLPPSSEIRKSNNIDNEINPLPPDETFSSVEQNNGGGSNGNGQSSIINGGAGGNAAGLSSIANVFRPEIFPNLYELSLSFCQLSGELEPFPSLQLTNLEISMGLKSATTLTSAMFQSLRQLEWLALDHNTIQTISDYCFYSNKNLSYVNLEFNRIGGSLPRQMFHPDIHQSITQLRLSHNKIHTILSDSFLSFPAINLDLSYNSIHIVERHAFSVAPLTTTTTSANNNSPGSGGGGSSSSSGNQGLNDLSASSIVSSTNTLNPSSSSSSQNHLLGNGGGINPLGLNLYLSHNRLSSLKSAAFSQEKFSLVDLSYNHLSHFHFDTFGRKTLLGGLNISHNNVERVAHNPNRKYLIKFLDLSFNKIQYKGILDLDGVCPTDLIDLSHNRIDRVDSHLFPSNCSLKELNLRGNHITTLDPESFTNLRDLTVLNLRENQISYVPEILFIRNHKLTFLDMSHNKIRSLPRDSMVGSNIEILLLASNQFVNLPVGALSQISRRLKVLDISQNSLEHLDSTMFESIPGLVHLNLSNNRLSILPDNAFANLASLRELDLSGNFLRANFKELFHFLPKLKVLQLSGCGIKVLPFLPLSHLISLDLSSNGLAEIKMQSLASLSRLRHMDLSNNELTSSRIPSWTPLSNLVTLKLSKNPLKSLTKDTFFGLNRLENLEILDMGKLDRFDSDVLSYLTNLKSLAVETYPNIEKYRFRLGAVLSGMDHLEELKVQIKEATLSDQLFGGILPKMRKLTIMGSNLRRIELLAFEGLQNCLHMDLTISHTAVDDIPPRIFELLQNAEWARLDLSFNKLSSLDSSAVYPNISVWFSKGTKLLQGGLILDGNEWICDCNLVWIGEWLRRWLRESFESHSTAVPLVHSMYESIRVPRCLDSKGNSIPLIELYADVMCHASALSSSSTLHHHQYKYLYGRWCWASFFYFLQATSTALILIISPSWWSISSSSS